MDSITDDQNCGLRTLNWDDVKEVCKFDGSTWNVPSRAAWAKEAWEIISRAGLATYENELGRVVVVIRLLALAGIYADFLDRAYSDGFAPEVGFWAEAFELTPLKVGMLVKGDEWLDYPDDGKLHLVILQSLANQARSDVVSRLALGFGGDSGMLISLYKSNNSMQTGYVESDDEIVNNVSWEKVEVLNWIREGCYAF